MSDGTDTPQGDAENASTNEVQTTSAGDSIHTADSRADTDHTKVEAANDQQPEHHATMVCEDGNLQSGVAGEGTQKGVEGAKEADEPVDIQIIFNKTKYNHTADMNQTILQLKLSIEKLTGVPAAMQKVMYKGSTSDEKTLKELKVTKNAKFLVIGSTMTDLLKVAAPKDGTMTSASAPASPAASKEPLCKQTPHKKVLDKYGKPEDVAVGIKGEKHPLPPAPLTGMYNKYGGKTRLTFKLDQDELWIGTKERTQKIKMGSIKTVVSEPIDDHEEYHIVGLQLGTTDQSKYWIYWVPAQYVDAIKDTVCGKWTYM